MTVFVTCCTRRGIGYSSSWILCKIYVSNKTAYYTNMITTKKRKYLFQKVSDSGTSPTWTFLPPNWLQTQEKFLSRRKAKIFTTTNVPQNLREILCTFFCCKCHLIERTHVCIIFGRLSPNLPKSL